MIAEPRIRSQQPTFLQFDLSCMIKSMAWQEILYRGTAADHMYPSGPSQTFNKLLGWECSKLWPAGHELAKRCIAEHSAVRFKNHYQALALEFWRAPRLQQLPPHILNMILDYIVVFIKTRLNNDTTYICVGFKEFIPNSMPTLFQVRQVEHLKACILRFQNAMDGQINRVDLTVMSNVVYHRGRNYGECRACADSPFCAEHDFMYVARAYMQRIIARFPQ